MTTTNIGQHLYAARIRREYESISYYRKNYADIPISKSYYRDIDSGRKPIMLGTAEMLCQVLKLEKTEFFFQLLRDLLPPDAADSLLKPISNTSFQSSPERDVTSYFLTVVFSSKTSPSAAANAGRTMKPQMFSWKEYSLGADAAKAKKRLLKNAK
ncbi:MAG: hypothetical protein LBC03_04545 [Nitrososphaerota archaeon]|nr:hypothetical protein [Nitrososphaerota archaeon]